MSIDRLRANYPLAIRWVYFPLHPDTPEEGMSLQELFPGRDLTPFRERMQGLMREAGLPYGERTHTYNSRLAQELAKWAEGRLDEQALDALHRRLYEAYFVTGTNIGDRDELVKIAGQSGLNEDEARAMLEQRTMKEAIDHDWLVSRQYGITGVPTFVGHDLMVVGCQPYEVLERFVQHLQSLADEAS